MTKRKALLLLLLLACAAVAGLVVTTSRPHEPTYDGRTLSEWLDQRSNIEPAQRVHGVQQIGTNALPLLLEWVQSYPSPFEIKLSEWLNPFHINPSDKKLRRGEEAVIGFKALGEEANMAIPALIPLLDSTNMTTTIYAVKALGAIGKAALPALLDVVTNSLAHRNCDRFFVGSEISQLGTNAFLAKPALLAHIGDPNEQVASAAIYVLGNLGGLQDVMALPPQTTADIVPALCANLGTTNIHLLTYTILALSHFNSKASPAVPALLQKLTSTNPQIRAAAAAALSKIDPQALARAQKQ